MAVGLEIASVDQSVHLREAEVDKYFAAEVTTIDVLDRGAVSTALRPALGDIVTLEDDGHLVSGGVIVEREETDIADETGTRSVLTVQGYESLMSRIVIDRMTIPEQDLLVTFDALFSAHLQPLGYANLSPTSGGPTVAAVEVEKQTLADVLNQLSALSGWFWRINGDRECAFHAPGGIAGPVTLSVANGNIRVHPFTVHETAVESATRLFIQTGSAPKDSPSTLSHSEGRVGNGAMTTFLLNVEPKEPPTVVDENGTPHTIGGGTWSYDADQHAVVRTSPLGNGVPILIGPYAVELPAWTRVWDASTTDSTGAWDASLLGRDLVLHASDIADIVQATAWGHEELARRTEQPKRVTCVTSVKGFYPLQEVTISVPDRGITGDYLVERVRAILLDDDHVDYELTCVEGSRVGRPWFEYFKQRGATTSGGSLTVAPGSGGGGGGGGSSTVQRIPLGGANDSGDRPADWTNVVNAIPWRLGGPAMAGTWTLRAYRRLIATTSPASAVELRLYDVTNAVTLASVSSTSSTGWAEATVSFQMPLTEGVCVLQYQVSGGSGSPAEARVGMCSLERG